MSDDPDWFDKAADEVFDSPQALLIRNRLAAAEAEKRSKERAAEEFRRRNPPPTPAAARAIGSEFAAVAEGRKPMAVPTTTSHSPYTKAGSPTVKRPDAPRPGSTGAISIKLAISTITSQVSNAEDPRAEAAAMLQRLTSEIIQAANEADPSTED